LSGQTGLDRYEEDDWARYGGARPRSADEAEELLRDDPFAEYRSENGRPSPNQEERRPRRARANVLGLLVAVSAIALVAGFATLASPAVVPTPTPRGTLQQPSPTAATPLLSPRPTLRAARVAVEIPVPIPIVVPDRAFATDDGTTIYLAGNVGALPIDAIAGTAGTVWSGADYPKGLRRLVYDRGLWVSTWPAGYPSCGPPCWGKATTYRIDPASGSVTLTLEGTFLVGAQYDGVYVGSLGRLRVLDPADGRELTAVSWKTAGEPRLGCGQLWSVELGESTQLRAVNVSSGDQIGSSSLPSSMTYGPVSSEGLCWMMSGQDGASAGKTQLTLLNPNGTVSGEYSYDRSIVVLDGEFWILTADGSVQRFEATVGVPFGQRYALPITPENGDPRTLFSAVGSLWLYRGQELIGFDVLTGSGNGGS
jgi:hypothetical protein